uniref:phospholipase D-like domain-containing protein n=2 Tax=Thiolapillus sp. TaxID=2017437 RepID=UPI003AF88863
PRSEAYFVFPLAQGTPGKQCGLAATGDYQPSLRSPWLAADVLVLGSGPADELETASLFFTTVLNTARKRIWIATPYFIPDETTQVALYLALLEGLDVRIITPRINDNWFVSNAAKVYLSELSNLGARIYYGSSPD